MTPQQQSTEVGVRELHNHLSKYLAMVEKGAEVIVTKRGRRLARLAPMDSDDDRLAELERLGLVAPPLAKGKLLSSEIEQVEADGSVSDLVAEQRR